MTVPPPEGQNPIPDEQPTQRIPATPDAGSAQTDAPLPPPANPQAGKSFNTTNDDEAKSGMGFKIATGVLALTTIGFAIWGYNANKNYNDLKASTDQEIAQLQEQIKQISATAGKKEAKEAAQIAAAKEKFKNTKSELKLEEKNLNKETSELDELRKEYDTAQANAEKKEGSLEAQLKAADAKAELAKQCATVLATGMAAIYGDVATGVTYKEVEQQLSKASKSCQDVVNVDS